jgi:hypothetical protein
VIRVALISFAVAYGLGILTWVAIAVIRIATSLARLVQLAEWQALKAGEKLPPAGKPTAARPARVWDHDDAATYEREQAKAKAKVTGGFGPPKG